MLDPLVQEVVVSHQVVLGTGLGYHGTAQKALGCLTICFSRPVLLDMGMTGHFCFYFFKARFFCVALIVLELNCVNQAGWPHTQIHLPLSPECGD